MALLTHPPADASAPNPSSPMPFLEIVECDATDAGAWDSFVEMQPSGSFYHYFGWKHLSETTLAHRCIYLAARSQGGLQGVLPLVFVQSRLFGRILCSLPFVNHGGPCAVDLQIASALCEAAVQRASDLKADYLELRCASAEKLALPAAMHKVNVALALDPNPDVLWKAFATSHRTNVRRSYKEGFETHSGGIELLPKFLTVIEHLWRSLGTPLYRPEFFEQVLRLFPGRTRIFAVCNGSVPAAAMLVGYGNGAAESAWGGSHPAFRHQRANYVLYWEMIQDACRRGYQRFNLGRSSIDSGGMQFKLRWNSRPEQQYWYFWRPGDGEMPQLNVDNPRYRLAIEIWKHLPLWATRIVGPRLARLIP